MSHPLPQVFEKPLSAIVMYWRERASLPRFAALAAALTAATCVLVPPEELSDVSVLWALLLCQCLLLRLLDDLADVTEDKEHSPERVLCLATSLLPHWTFLVCGLSIMLLGLFTVVPRSAGAFLYTLLGLAVWYLLLRRVLPFWARKLVILAKYPALMVGAALAITPWAALEHEVPLLVWLSLCSFEVHDDRRLDRPWLRLGVGGALVVAFVIAALRTRA